MMEPVASSVCLETVRAVRNALVQQPSIPDLLSTRLRLSQNQLDVLKRDFISKISKQAWPVFGRIVLEPWKHVKGGRDDPVHCAERSDMLLVARLAARGRGGSDETASAQFFPRWLSFPCFSFRT